MCNIFYCDINNIFRRNSYRKSFYLTLKEKHILVKYLFDVIQYIGSQISAVKADYNNNLIFIETVSDFYQNQRIASLT